MAARKQKTAAPKKYTEYSARTQQFMNAIDKFLIDKFGEIETQWEGLLLMLATNYELFWECKDRISADGLMTPNRFGGVEKNPLLKVQTDAQIQVIKLIAEFGLTPKAIRHLAVKNDENENDFIDGLIS